MRCVRLSLLALPLLPPVAVVAASVAAAEAPTACDACLRSTCWTALCLASAMRRFVTRPGRCAEQPAAAPTAGPLQVAVSIFNGQRSLHGESAAQQTLMGRPEGTEGFQHGPSSALDNHRQHSALARIRSNSMGSAVLATIARRWGLSVSLRPLQQAAIQPPNIMQRYYSSGTIDQHQDEVRPAAAAAATAAAACRRCLPPPARWLHCC